MDDSRAGSLQQWRHVQRARIVPPVSSLRQLATATLCVLAACARPAPPFDPAIIPATAPAALVEDKQALFVFPAATSLVPCSYGRNREPDAVRYSWTISVAASEDEWYVIDVWPVIRDTTTAHHAALDLAVILSAARPRVGRVSGGPPMLHDVLDTSHAEARALDGRVVVRLTDAALVRQLFARRPATVRFIACHQGNDQWTREVPVRYGRT